MRASHSVFAWLVRLLGLAAAVLAYFLFLGPFGYSALQGQRRLVEERSERVRERIAVNAALGKKLDSLQNDARALDRELRTSQNWVRPGEVMIVLPAREAETPASR